MTGSEVAAVASVAFMLQQLGNKYYASSAAWQEFPSQVKLLQEKHNTLASQLERYGQDVGPALLEAQKLMREEVQTLEKRSGETKKTSGCGKLCGIASLATKRVTETVFPEQIGRAVGDAIKAYDRIVEHLRTQKENEENIRSLASNSAMSLPFYEDNLYVPLEPTESSISTAIKEGNVGKPSVVLLYGGPGTGKSTLSRHIALKHKSDFDHVVFLECGPTLNPISVEVGLLQYMGLLYDLSETAELRLDEWHSKGARQSRLQNALRTRKLLIVLDDLHHPQVLQDLLISSGLKVKYLVTSQRDDICNNLTCNPNKFPIENLGDDETTSKNICKKMLAVHSGYSDGNTPPHLQEIVDKILDKAQGIPLVIATLGAQVMNADRDNPSVWKCLLGSPYQFLDEGMPLQNIHGIPYLKSYWSVLSDSVNSLGDEEKQMLLLLGICRDATVLEGVVFFLLSSVCTERKSNLLHFSSLKKKLKSRQLMSQNIRDHLQIHSLTKAFIMEQMKEPAKRLAALIVSKNSLAQEVSSSSGFVTKATVSCVLVRLYLDDNFVNDMLISQSCSCSTFGDGNKAIMEPFTLRLLALDANWADECHQAASQVFLDCAQHGSFRRDHYERLQSSPVWSIDVKELWVYINLRRVEEQLDRILELSGFERRGKA